jgi:hypothetical protein
MINRWWLNRASHDKKMVGSKSNPPCRPVIEWNLLYKTNRMPMIMGGKYEALCDLHYGFSGDLGLRPRANPNP